MKVSCFIRSYHKDRPWLEYCLRSLAKYGQELHEVVVVVPDAELASFCPMEGLGRARFEGWEVCHRRGYIDQQITKLHADQYCEGDFILYMDSDSMATEEIVPEEFMSLDETKHRLGFLFRPKLLIRDWEGLGDAECWRRPTEFILGGKSYFETMCALPYFIRRDTLPRLREHVCKVNPTNKIGWDFKTFMAANDDFSEFNLIGNFIHQRTPDEYRMIRAVGPGADGYPRPLKQFWSHAPIDSVKQQMEAILA